MEYKTIPCGIEKMVTDRNQELDIGENSVIYYYNNQYIMLFSFSGSTRGA
jgi:hypothetical protein